MDLGPTTTKLVQEKGASFAPERPSGDQQNTGRQGGRVAVPYVVSFTHQKGGVAKTTSAAALAATLAEEGYRVLIIDLDPTANLTASFGIKPAEVRYSAADILLGNEALTNICVPTPLHGVALAPSNADMATAARFLYLRPRFEHLLHTSLSQFGKPLYDFVLIDCPPALSSLTLTALTAANLTIIPVQCEYYSLQALDAMFKTIQQVRVKTNPRLSFRLLVVMFDKRGALHTRVLEMARQRYPDALFEIAIGFDTRLRESQLAGVPITVFAPSSRAAQQYRILAQELLSYVKTQST